MPYKFNPFTGTFDDVGVGGGGSTSPGGSDTQVQFNDGGAFAGVANSSVDNATGNITLGSRFISTVASASSAPAAYISGTWFAGTSSNALPALYVSPAGTSVGTSWATAGTAIGVNAPAAFAGNLLDLQVNGTRQAVVGSNGLVQTNLDVYARGILTNTGLGSSDWANWIGSHGNQLKDSAVLGWTSGAATLTADVILRRDAANILAQRNGTNAQTSRVYGTFTDASNYVRASLSSSSTAVTLAAETAGTGADNIPLNLTAAGTGTVKVNSVAEVVVSSTVAGLPAAPVVGMLTRVTDATAPAVGVTVTGGGAAAALVWYNGANWSVIGV